MLTKEDLQSLKMLIREEVEAEAKATRAHIGYRLLKVELNLNNVSNGLKDVTIRTEKVEDKIGMLEKKIDTYHLDVSRTFESVLHSIDELHTKLVHRVDKIERHIKI